MLNQRALILAMSTVFVAAAAIPLALRAGDDGPFAPSKLTTVSGAQADADGFYEAEVCGECHVAQHADWDGSLHSRAHHDGLYLAFAKRARAEGGDDLYRFCSSCHAAGAVATGEIPGDESTETTFLTDEGVTCDVCHHVKDVRAVHGAGGANASIVLDDGEDRYGPIADPSHNPGHGSVHSGIFAKAEFCSGCHTLLHPHNGVTIENTFEEWKASPYAAAGIQCQDCHMRSVEQAVEVARTMEPLEVPGPAVKDGPVRPNVHAHLFVGANVNHAATGGSERHAAIAEARLKSAARLELQFPEQIELGHETEIVVAITNVAAGHSIPTSITELRQVWLCLEVRDADHRVFHESGVIDPETGRVDPQAPMFNSVRGDVDGKVTYLPWRAVKILKERLIAAKETVHETYTVLVPADAKLPVEVSAVLRYRSAPQDVMDELFGKGKFAIQSVDMARSGWVQLPITPR